MNKISLKTKLKMNRGINCNQVIEQLKKIKELKIVNVGGGDFVDKKKKLVFAILW